MPPSAPEILEDCLGLLASALLESQSHRFEEANRALAVALVTAAGIPREFIPEFRAALCYCAALIQSRKSPGSVTPEMRSQAVALLDQCQSSGSLEMFQVLMFEVLSESGEHLHAIRFGERALSIAVEKKESIAIAERLSKIGRCYARLGLRDHAAIAYRGAARIFRNETADPRLPAVLLALGNSIRKSAPPQAEALYQEAAALWEKKGQLESATPAWMNLGIVCSDQGRFEEAIHFYERVRQVRESSPSTPPVRIGVLYNNLASCYRKMARFAEAHQAIERSLGILTEASLVKPEDANSLALAMGTKGMILYDEGRDLESLEWFRRACAEFEKQPSPNLENMIEELEHEAAALTRLGRRDEARATSGKMESLRQAAAAIPSVGHDGGAAAEPPEGALFIELDGGLRGNADEREILKLGGRLDEILKEQNLGEWKGLIRIPECSTLIYYGSNADSMYDALDGALRSDSGFEGALITIRQKAQQRQIVLPRRSVH